MGQTVQAVYENGQLRPLMPLNLAEGQQVSITVRTRKEEDELMKQALGDLVAHWPDAPDEVDEELDAKIDEIFGPFQAGKPLSEIIVEDRGEL